MYNRCSLPRIIAKDVQEEETLGDSEDVVQPDLELVENEPVMSKKDKRLSRMRDLDNWGQEILDVVDDNEVYETEVDLETLSEGDEELIQWLTEIQHENEEVGSGENVGNGTEPVPKEKYQVDLSRWVTKEVVKLTKVVEKNPENVLNLKQTLLPYWKIQQKPRIMKHCLITGKESAESDASPVKEETTVSEVRSVIEEEEVPEEVVHSVVQIVNVRIIEEEMSEEVCNSVEWLKVCVHS